MVITINVDTGAMIEIVTATVVMITKIPITIADASSLGGDGDPVISKT